MSTHDDTALTPDTLLIHADKALNPTSSVAPPIYQTSTFRAETAEEFVEMASGVRHPRFYTRYGNPTQSQTEAVVAALEHAEGARVMASGMGAISTTVLSLVKQGDHVVAQHSHYAGTLGLLEQVLPRFGVQVTFVDQADTAAFEQAIQPHTTLIVVETPSNPLLRLTDLRAVAGMAHARGILTMADNTFATPINQRPLDLGIDIVVHSATKYLGGHSDLIAGVVATRADLLDRIWETSIILGASLGPFDSWLMLRGLRTLALRIERHNRTALTLAHYLQTRPEINAVHYPGLETHPQHALARAQMSGFGGMLSFELRGGYAATDRFISRLQLVTRAASLGGTESLIVHPAAMWAHTRTPEQLDQAGINTGLVRFSVGLEHEADLIADIGRALGE